MQGFVLKFTVSKEQVVVEDTKWNLSAIFAFTVSILSAVVLFSIGFILQRYGSLSLYPCSSFISLCTVELQLGI